MKTIECRQCDATGEVEDDAPCTVVPDGWGWGGRYGPVLLQKPLCPDCLKAQVAPKGA